ncbi:MULTISPECIES: hypothetical protein [Providencia]|uniref:Uncharacterized protein n=2 Tax=Providencia TaxID=586 RepID=A0AA42K1P3_9GAMM|nr:MULTISPECIES: hypothetical protein [Providencia]MBC8653119.1 hypothetical protein [Providencia vermicola]APC12623.1 hypothetical protein RB151_029650 [Providencia rettgeri]EIL1984142.1 hypothetical protein [Providencia rettgeri]EIU7558918.1 hypothetical protein [Providencia rettgeri]EIU9516238.1 hypothetical protein [Providencia rettgeri]
MEFKLTSVYPIFASGHPVYINNYSIHQHGFTPFYLRKMTDNVTPLSQPNYAYLSDLQSLTPLFSYASAPLTLNFPCVIPKSVPPDPLTFI